jgi:uncharacterized protein (TIGR03084 family)
VTPVTEPRDPCAALVDDLAAEVAALDSVVAPLDEAALRRPTPAAGWDVADTLAHLAAFDDHAVRAVTDPDAFRVEVAALVEAGGDPIADATVEGRRRGLSGCRAWWRAASTAFGDVASTLDRSMRVPWYGPDMGAMSFVTARLMETWAHGQDIRDAVGLPPSVSGRLRHVADLGVRARPYAFAVRGMDLPSQPIRVEVSAPDGSTWAWGPYDAGDLVRGTALDLCLLVTQRRHPEDLTLEVVGPAAAAWVAVAQAFAGPAGPGREPLRHEG